MIVLGIDPGLSMAGWGVVYKGNTDKYTCLGYGCIKTYPKDCLADRLKFLFYQTHEIIEKYKPEVVAMEQIFFFKRFKCYSYHRSGKGCINIGCCN